MDEFLCKFLQDIGVEKVSKSFSTPYSIGYITEFKTSSIQNELKDIRKSGKNNSLCDDFLMKFMTNPDEYNTEAFKLYCLLANLTYSKVNFRDDDMSAIAFSRLSYYLN